jgi:hypothetical protein
MLSDFAQHILGVRRLTIWYRDEPTAWPEAKWPDMGTTVKPPEAVELVERFLADAARLGFTS